jgi:hypothetical protein
VAGDVAALEPPDRVRCQALRPNKTWSPFALGPAHVRADGEKVGGSRQVDRQWRCNVPPVVIVTEAKPGKDGQRGSMSLCADCFVQLCLQQPESIGPEVEDLRPEHERKEER